jgi:hypothetical protein
VVLGEFGPRFPLDFGADINARVIAGVQITNDWHTATQRSRSDVDQRIRREQTPPFKEVDLEVALFLPEVARPYEFVPPSGPAGKPPPHRNSNSRDEATLHEGRNLPEPADTAIGIVREVAYEIPVAHEMPNGTGMVMGVDQRRSAAFARAPRH